MLQPLTDQKRLSSAIIGLGANLPSVVGLPVVSLQHALSALNDNNSQVQKVSRFYTTPCFPMGAGPDYVNAVATLTTSLCAEDLLSQLHEVENLLGRERTARWGQRTADIDLLAYDDLIRPNKAIYGSWRDLSAEAQRRLTPDEMILPHPRMQDRAFVLVPMMDVAPEWKHPVLGLTVQQMHDDLDPDETAQIVPLEM